MRKLCLTILTVSVLLMVSGCLDTTARFQIDADGSGTLTLEYRIDRTAYDTGVFDDSDTARPIPITRTEFENAVQLVQGLTLRSYRVSDEGETVLVSASIRFSGYDALIGLLGEESLSVSADAAGTTWRQVVTPGGGTVEGGAVALANDLDPYSITYIVDPRASIRSATGGDVEWTEDSATVTVTLGDVVRSTEPVVVLIKW